MTEDADRYVVPDDQALAEYLRSMAGAGPGHGVLARMYLRWIGKDGDQLLRDHPAKRKK